MNVSAWRFYIQEGKRFFGIFLPDTVKAMVQGYLDQGYGQVLLPQSLLQCQDWEGMGLAALASSASKAGMPGTGQAGAKGSVPSGSCVFYLGHAQAGPVSYSPSPWPFWEWPVKPDPNNPNLVKIVPEVETPRTKGAYIKGETVPVRVKYTAHFIDPAQNESWYIPRNEPWVLITSLPSSNGQPWLPGEYGILASKWYKGDHTVPVDTMTGPWLLAEVKLALDEHPNDPQKSFEADRVNDIISYLPKGSAVDDGYPGGPQEARIHAVLWGSIEPLNKNNWDAGHVDMNEWNGRPEIANWTVDFDFFDPGAGAKEVSDYIGWCSNYGEAAGPDYRLEDNLGRGFDLASGVATAKMFSEDCGGHCVVEAKLNAPGSGGLNRFDAIRLPMDVNENNIADAWELKYGWPSWATKEALKDEDYTSVNCHVGDGFCNFDEYRGFLVTKNDNAFDHIRTAPTVKDVFVFDTLDKYSNYIFLTYNKYLVDNNLGIIYHRITTKDQMGTRLPSLNGAPEYRCGYLDKNGLKKSIYGYGQYPIGYVSTTGDIGPSSVLARAYGNMPNGELIHIREDKLEQADQEVINLGFDISKHKKYIIAHEAGHKFYLEHNMGNNVNYTTGWDPQTIPQGNYQINTTDNNVLFKLKYHTYKGLVYSISDPLPSSNLNWYSPKLLDCYISEPVPGWVYMFEFIPPVNGSPEVQVQEYKNEIMDWSVDYDEPQQTFSPTHIYNLDIK